ncbi:hypothetical protein CHUAL_000090 [Chamberlinius hualienensis]
MAETVDLIRDYSKDFILHPINAKLEKIEFYLNEKIEKMEKYFLETIQQLLILIETNNHKTCLLDRAMETLQRNQNKLEKTSEYIGDIIVKKFQQTELQLNDMNQSNEIKTQKFGQLENLIENNKQKTGELHTAIETLQQNHIKLEEKSDFIHETNEKKFQKITESVKQIKSVSQTLSEYNNVEKLDKTNKVIGQLQTEMSNKNEEIRDSLIKEDEKLKKIEKETKETIKTYNKDIKEKYDKCIQLSEMQTLRLSEQIENDEILKKDLNKAIEDIKHLQSKVEPTSKAKQNKIKRLKKVGYGMTQLIVFILAFALIYSLYLKVKTSSVAIEKIKSIENRQLKIVEIYQTIDQLQSKCEQFKNLEAETKHRIDQLQSTVKPTLLIIEEIKSKEIEPLKNEVNAIEKRVKQINSKKELGQIEKMEKHFIQRIQQLVALIESNNHKTCLLDKAMETLQLNQNKSEALSEYISEIIVKKFQQTELQLNDLKLSREIKAEDFDQLENFIENNKQKTGELDKAIETLQLILIKSEEKSEWLHVTNEKKFEMLTESIKQIESVSQKLSQSIEVDFRKKLDKTNEVIGELQTKMRKKNGEIRNSLIKRYQKFKKIENKTKETIHIFSKNITEKYDECIQLSEMQTKKLSEQITNYEILKKGFNKVIEDIEYLQSKVESTSKAIEDKKQNKIKLFKKIGYGKLQIIVCIVAFALLYSLYLKVETSSMTIEEIKSNEIRQFEIVEIYQTTDQLQSTIDNTIEEIKSDVINLFQQFKEVEAETNKRINEMLSKVENTSMAIEKVKSNEIGQLKIKVNVIEERVNQINFNMDMDEVISNKDMDETGQLDKVIKTLQVNQTKLEGKSDLMHDKNEKKFKAIELCFNDIKPSKDLIEIKNKFQQLTELVKQSEIQSKQLSQNTEEDFTKKERDVKEGVININDGVGMKKTVRQDLVNLLWSAVVIEAIFPTNIDFEQLLAFTARQAEEKVDQILSRCYGEYGCFSLGGKFVSMARPVNLFPYSVETIGMKMALNTRNNPNLSQLLTPNDVSNINSTHFNLTIPTKVIVHGFLESGSTSWCSKMKDELLIYDNYNVIIVDWLIGALPPYTQAVANARLIGAIIAKFFQLLQKSYSYKPENIHIVGHSLGAHVAGYVGQRLHRLGRISGLDPAGPYFENTDEAVRLDPGDAEFVDIIHTDGASLLNRAFGMVNTAGHLDFYPNGGAKQPGCEESVADALEREDMNLYRGFRHWVSCRHVRAHEYFTESINSHCRFEAYECDTYSNFLAGRCIDCTNGGHCARMGFHADQYAPKHKRRLFSTVRMFLATNSNPPFCATHQLIRIQTSGLQRSITNGLSNSNITIEIDSADRQGEEKQHIKATTKVSNEAEVGDDTFRVLVHSVENPISRINIQLTEPKSQSLTNQIAKIFQGPTTLYIDKIYVENIENGQITEFCNRYEKIVKVGQSLSLYPSPRC